MDNFERRYLRTRMERETAIADRASCPFSASIHRELARLYAERLGEPVAAMAPPVAQAVNH